MMRNLELLLFLCYCRLVCRNKHSCITRFYCHVYTCYHDHEPDDSIIRAYSMTATFVDTGYE